MASEFKMATFGQKRKYVPATKQFVKIVKPAFRKRVPAAALRRRGKELKTVDLNFFTAELSTTGNVQLLNGLVEGTDGNNRIGRRINMKSVKLRLWFAKTETAAAATNAEYIRYALVYDRQPNGATPAWADVFQNINVGGTTQSDAFSNSNPTNFDRFVILRDGCRSYTNSSTTATADVARDSTSFVPQVENWYVKLKGLESHFIAGAGAGTIADFRTGSLLLMSIGTATAANGSYSINGTARVRYHDE